MSTLYLLRPSQESHFGRLGSFQVYVKIFRLEYVSDIAVGHLLRIGFCVPQNGQLHLVLLASVLLEQFSWHGQRQSSFILCKRSRLVYTLLDRDLRFVHSDVVRCRSNSWWVHWRLYIRQRWSPISSHCSDVVTFMVRQSCAAILDHL